MEMNHLIKETSSSLASLTCYLLPIGQLPESGAAPYSDAPCAVVSLASTSLDGQTELRLD